MKLIITLSIALLAFTSCQKEALVETVSENSEKTLVSFSTVDAVKNFINGKWAWKETILKQRTGQLLSTTPENSGIEKIINIGNSTIVIVENGVQTVSESYTLTQTDRGWLFEGGGCSGILYRIGDQLIVAGSVMDRADNYYERTR